MVKAYDRVWFIGDNSMAASFGEYFQNIYGHYQDNYMRKHYDAYCSATGPDNFAPGNILTRLFNSLINGINEQTLLPKAFVLVFDDDILDAIDHYLDGISYLISKSLEWLANQMHCAITAYKEKLPSKARKFRYPTILWTLIPYHDIYGHYNDYKWKFNKVMMNVVSLFREMDFITMTNWNRKELGYFSK